MSEVTMITEDELVEQYEHRLAELSEQQEQLADSVAVAAMTHFLPNQDERNLLGAINDARNMVCPVDSTDKDVLAVRELYFDDDFRRCVSAVINVQVDRQAINQLDY